MANEKRLIDANALKEYLNSIEASGGHEYYRKGVDTALHFYMPTIIDDAPTVDAEPVVHGRWVMKETMIRSPFAENCYCSECQTSGSPQWKRCPVCEAKMDGS